MQAASRGEINSAHLFINRSKKYDPDYIFPDVLDFAIAAKMESRAEIIRKFRRVHGNVFCNERIKSPTKNFLTYYMKTQVHDELLPEISDVIVYDSVDYDYRSVSKSARRRFPYIFGSDLFRSMLSVK